MRSRNKIVYILIAVALLLLIVLLGLIMATRDYIFADIQKEFENDVTTVNTTEGSDASGNIPEETPTSEETEEPDAPELEDFLNGRDPETFTLAEYQALTPEQQAQFPDYFKSMDVFNDWYDAVKKNTEQEDGDGSGDTPEETPDAGATEEPDMPEQDDFLNGRDPETLTWAEYQALTPEQQAMFPDYFESYDAFLRWKNKVEP